MQQNLNTGSYDRTCKIWDTHKGQEVHVLDGHKNVVYAVAFNNPFADKIVTGSFDRFDMMLELCLLACSVHICIVHAVSHLNYCTLEITEVPIRKIKARSPPKEFGWSCQDNYFYMNGEIPAHQNQLQGVRHTHDSRCHSQK